MKKHAYILLFTAIFMMTGCGNAEYSAPTSASILTGTDLTAFARTSDALSSIYEETAPQPSVDADAVADDEKDESYKDDDINKEELPEYTVKEFDKELIMYATNAVNVRKGPSTDFETVGSLRLGQEVSVTGQADTDWYEILYADGKSYVSNKYLQDEKPADEPVVEADAQPQETASQDAQPQEPAPQEPVVEVKNVAGVILVGDSRFVQMRESVGDNPCTWVAENGKGYNWFNENAVARIDGCVGKGSKILINLGVNDAGNHQKYLALVNAKAEEWVNKGAKVYYASVNPVWENPYVTEDQVEYFNAQMQGGLSGNVHWIDSNSYLKSIGYKLVDGLHYSTETYQNIYAYYMSCL